MADRAPSSVWLSVWGLALAVTAQAVLAVAFTPAGEVGWAMYAFAAVLVAAVAVGLVRRSRLAWLWGRWLAGALAVLVGAAAATMVARRGFPPGTDAVLLVVSACGLAVTAVALGRGSAFAWFRLVCPVCAARTGVGADLLFRQARCPTCQHEW